jgi:hypothetical protein
MKNILLISTGRGRKRVEFDAARHTVIMGNLCDKATLRVLGKVIQAITEP